MDRRLSRRARADLDAIADYTLAAFGEEQTARYLNGLDASFSLLADNPFMGTQYDGTRRRYVYKQHIVYYRVTPNYVLIVEVRHGRQSPPG